MVKCELIIDDDRLCFENIAQLIFGLEVPLVPNNAMAFCIDAICINQDDVTEREKQVLLMQEISFHP